MTAFALTLILVPLALFTYAYVGYPALLWVIARSRPPRPLAPEPLEWPKVTLTLPVYNEERILRAAIEQLLALDYPADRRQIIVISDASTDATDAIALEYAPRGVQLVRLAARGGKTAGENAAGAHATGDIIVNVDATTVLAPDALKALVRAFGDPTVGAASGRDVSVDRGSVKGHGGEAGYVGYEMWIRGMETRVNSIVGVSGCFYGIRRELYDSGFPPVLSRDFATALVAHEHGLRAVSVPDAVCGVPRTASLRAEYRRKTRTMHRGLETLWFKRHLMNPFRHGSFALMLISHKLCRWLVLPALPASAVGVLLLTARYPLALGLALTGIAVGAVLSTAAFVWPEGRPIPRVFALAGFGGVAIAAGAAAWIHSLQDEHSPVWEPTRRPA